MSGFHSISPIRESFACWYVQTTGIWKTVWLEEVSESCIDRLKITPDLTNNSVKLEVHLSENAARERTIVLLGSIQDFAKEHNEMATVRQIAAILEEEEF